MSHLSLHFVLRGGYVYFALCSRSARMRHRHHGPRRFPPPRGGKVPPHSHRKKRTRMRRKKKRSGGCDFSPVIDAPKFRSRSAVTIVKCGTYFYCKGVPFISGKRGDLQNLGNRVEYVYCFSLAFVCCFSLAYYTHTHTMSFSLPPPPPPAILSFTVKRKGSEGRKKKGRGSKGKGKGGNYHSNRLCNDGRRIHERTP